MPRVVRSFGALETKKVSYLTGIRDMAGPVTGPLLQGTVDGHVVLYSSPEVAVLQGRSQ